MNERYRAKKEKNLAYLFGLPVPDNDRALVKQFISEPIPKGARAGGAKSLSTQANYAAHLFSLALYTKKPLKSTTEGDLSLFFKANEEKKALGDYKRTFKQFFVWAKMRGVVANKKLMLIPTRRKLKLTENELVSADDAKKLIQASKNARDRCLVALLYETGARIGELLALRVKDVDFKKRYVLLHLEDSKTEEGKRPVLVIDSSGFLKKWINEHPKRADPNSPLFYTLRKQKNLFMGNEDAQLTLKRLSEAAGVPYKHPHLWRHSAATRAAREGMNAPSMRLRFGWSDHSSVPDRYTHMNYNDLNEQILISRGLLENKKEANAFGVILCPRCEADNESTNRLCAACGMALGREEAERSLKQEEDLLKRIESLEKQVKLRGRIERFKKK